MMYRQRLFMETAPKLIQGFHSADAGELYKIMFEKQMLPVLCLQYVLLKGCVFCDTCKHSIQMCRL